MSKVTKRKHVMKEVMDDYVVPDENQEIVKVLAGRGNNLHEIENAEGKTFLVSMPSKFRKSVWIKRGDFVIVEPIEEGNKVCAEIVYILYPKQIKYLKVEKLWPEAFDNEEEKECLEKENLQTKRNGSKDKDLSSSSDSDDDYDDDDDDDDLFVNTNRPCIPQISDESDSDEEHTQEENMAEDNLSEKEDK